MIVHIFTIFYLDTINVCVFKMKKKTYNQTGDTNKQYSLDKHLDTNTMNFTHVLTSNLNVQHQYILYPISYTENKQKQCIYHL